MPDVIGQRNAMRDLYSVLRMNSDFVRSGKVLLDSIDGLSAPLNDEKLVECADLIRSCFEEFDSYGQIVQGASSDSLSDFDFYQGFMDSYRINKRNRKRSIEWLFNGEQVQPDAEYRSRFVVSGCLANMQSLPRLLMDNALKYTPPGHPISINFEDDYGKTITISNWGPMLVEGEEESILSVDFNYRGKWASYVVKQGHGLGLRHASVIMSSHPWLKAEISASSSHDYELFNGVPYSVFSLSLFFLDDHIQAETVVNTWPIRDYLARFIFHSYISANPQLCREVSELGEAISHVRGYSEDDVVQLKRKVFQLKCLVMEHMIEWHVKDRTYVIENDDEIDATEGRFDDLICKAIDEFVVNNNRMIVVERQGVGFFVSPMYSSYDVFFYLFADYITTCCHSDRLFVSADSDGVFFSLEGNARFDRYVDERFSLMEGILDNHNLRITTDFRNSYVRLERFS